MNCRDFQNLLTDWLDETLPPQDSGLMDEHLRSCRFCQSTVTETQNIRDAFRRFEACECPSRTVRAAYRKILSVEFRLFREKFFTLWHSLAPKIRFGVAFIVILMIALITARGIQEHNIQQTHAYSEKDIKQGLQEASWALGFILKAAEKSENLLVNEIFPEKITGPINYGMQKALLGGE